MLDLDARKQEILRAAIHAYIHDAEPVGSERIAHRLRLHISPATTRNEMAALEELGQPEFHDARTAQPVLSALEREEVLSDLLEAALGRQVRVTIGSEHRHEDLRGTTVVAPPYQMGGRPAGALGIVGPTRMKYGKVTSLSEILTESP